MGWSTQLGSDACGGTGGLGANWTVVTGFELPQQTGGICQPNTLNVYAHALYTAVTWPNDQYASVKVVAANTSASRIVIVALRGSTAARTNYECVVAGPLGTAATLTIYRYNAGTPTVLAGGTAVYTVNSGDIMHCEIQGSTIILKINGGPVLGPVVDGSPIVSGSAGIGVYSADGAITDAKGDDWLGGDFAGGGGGTSGHHLLLGVGQ